MLYIICADSKEYRTTQIADIRRLNGETETIVLDDTLATLSELEGYLYPSLFATTSPIVKIQFMLGADALDTTLAKKLVASPTVFVFEEILVPASVLTPLKKLGAIVHTADKQKVASQKSDIFVVAAALTAPHKKDRWLTYHRALQEHAVEAIVGILYWKVRDLMIKGGDKSKWSAVYTALLVAHANAWKTGTPLALAIEKVILTA